MRWKLLNENLKKASARRVRASADDFVCALRLADGFDSRLIGELKEALIAAGAAYADDDVLPKELVNDLVGLYAWIHASSHLYKGDEAEQIRRAAQELQELIFVHIVPAGPDGAE